LKSTRKAKFYFIEVAARVGGAYIADVIEVASGINLWREWARLEVGAGKQPYELPPVRREHAGVILSLARQEAPGYVCVYRSGDRLSRHEISPRRICAEVALANERIQQLLDSYARRFHEDFFATQPVPDKTHFLRRRWSFPHFTFSPHSFRLCVD